VAKLTMPLHSSRQQSRKPKSTSLARMRVGLWNLLLSENMRRYQYDKTFLFYNEMASLIKDLKKFEEFYWLKNFDSAAAQQVARNLDTG
jgi:transposase